MDRAIKIPKGTLAWNVVDEIFQKGKKVPKHHKPTTTVPDLLFVTFDSDGYRSVGVTPMEVAEEKPTLVYVYRLENVEKFRKLVSVEKVRE